ncbi:MFS transporter [Acinetobacter sp. PK01]|uniref:MFS transporter n=1 Tax=Acinetobacter sp. PK01 TaxID=2930198 RepID=UPI001FB71E10|nr:MFS transporter [Acinetobacter sp. PK01]UOG16762.1 MFS transporter [Acinetobacter sp. PK01]
MKSALCVDRLWNRAFIFCVLNNLFLFTYYFALLAILPVYIMKDLGGTVKEAGLALTLFLISSILVRPFSGLISEKIGKKLSFRGSELFFVLFAFSYLCIDSMWSLLLVRFIHGIWFSILTTVTVPVANEFIPEQRKGEGMGYFVMSTNLGVVFGPLLALTITQYASFTVLFAILSGLMTLGFIFCLCIPIHDEDSRSLVKPSLSSLTRHDIIEFRVLSVGMVALLTAFAYSSVMSFIAAYTETKQLMAYTSSFFLVFACSMILVRPWVGRWFDQKGASVVIYPSFILFAIGLAVVSQLNQPWVLWLSAVLIGIGYGTLFPCLQTVAIQSVPRQRIGHAISTYFTLFDLGLAVGSVIMGVLIAYWGYAATYLFCAMMTLVTLMVYRVKVAAKVVSVQQEGEH